MSYNYSNYNYEDMAYDRIEVSSSPRTSREIQLIVEATITGVGTMINSLVLLFLICKRDLRTLQFLAAGLLALCDLVRNCSAILLIIGVASHNWIFGDAVCKITRYMHFCSSIVSSWHLALVIIVRYNWTFRHGSYLTTMRPERMVLLSLLTWLLVIVGSIPVVITYSAWQVPFSEPPVSICLYQADLDKSRGLIISDGIVRFCLPLCCILVPAVLTTCQGCGPAPPGVQCSKAVIISTPLLFICLQLPTQAFAVWIISNAIFDPNLLAWHQYADSLSYSSTIFNPVLQAFSLLEFKAVLVGLVGCAKRYDASKAEKKARRNLNKTVNNSK